MRESQLFGGAVEQQRALDDDAIARGETGNDLDTTANVLADGDAAALERQFVLLHVDDRLLPVLDENRFGRHRQVTVERLQVGAAVHARAQLRARAVEHDPDGCRPQPCRHDRADPGDRVVEDVSARVDRDQEHRPRGR